MKERSWRIFRPGPASIICAARPGTCCAPRGRATPRPPAASGRPRRLLHAHRRAAARQPAGQILRPGRPGTHRPASLQRRCLIHPDVRNLRRPSMATRYRRRIISGALHSFVLSTALELPRGMRVNVVSPNHDRRLSRRLRRARTASWSADRRATRPLARRAAGLRHPNCGDERVPGRMRRDGLADPRPAGGLADDPSGAVPVQPSPVGGQEDRPAGALADGQVDRPGGARRQRVT